MTDFGFAQSCKNNPFNFIDIFLNTADIVRYFEDFIADISLSFADIVLNFTVIVNIRIKYTDIHLHSDLQCMN